MARKKKRGNSGEEEFDLEIMSLRNPVWNVRSKRLTDKQKKFLELALDPSTKVIFLNGPAGSTKTYMAVYSALRMLSENEKLDLLYVRTIIESADRGMGALPGNIDEKFNPYMDPLMDKLEEMLKVNIYKDLIEKKKVDARPVNFLRGMNWVDKIIISDESQNFTFNELVTLVTRIGENSKLFICGDSMQSDIGGRSGFTEMCKVFHDSESENQGIHFFTFTEQDIKRSQVLKFIIKKLQSHKGKN
jgi:phosphate starvation-inducible protein PhoH and related proteins